ncbi:MAG: cyanophycinase [Bryobacterales bacterium]|nr:cyanophycinase [Bryobacterales bacterium]
MAAKRKPQKPKLSGPEGTPCDARGDLVIIGGHENKEGHRPILEVLARRAGKGKLVVATLASDVPDEQWEQYRDVFRSLGVTHVEHLDVRRREDLLDDPRLELFEDARVIFFAGGDQLKITSKFGGTALCEKMRVLYQNGATVAGTSSGASVMSETMMIAGEGETSKEVGESLRLTAGLGLISGMIIDQHFAQRGRIGRLLSAVAQNPRLLGLGIDEDTAAVFERNQRFVVLGSGAVSVVDGKNLSYSNVAENTSQAISAFGLRLHMLSQGDSFDLETRTPSNGTAEETLGSLAS